jgi:outer membrane protein TolC
MAGLLLATLSAILGAQPAAGPAKRTLQLGLKQAVDIALAPEGNARIQLAEELIYQAQTRSAQSRAALLPNLDASISEQNRTLNLSAIGIQIPVPIPGFRLPRLVGPFNTFDARATLSQSIFDLSSIRRFQASRVGISVAEAERESARDQVTGQVAKFYLWALRTDVEVAAGRANVELAEALLKLALHQKEAGTGMGVEVTRARVQLANERQRLLVAENERKQAYMELLRAMGLELDVPLDLTDKLLYTPMDAITVEQALAIAVETRADLKAQEQRAASAELSYRATKMERLPSVVGFADYGSIGSSIDNAVPTRTYGFSVRLPLFDGGRRDARRAENRSQLRQERIKTADLRQQIDLEIRLALNSLSSAEDQVKVAQEGLELAQTELAQARRRYEAGLASSVEVTDAQTRLARARDNQISALFNYNLARINLGQAMGAIRSMIK